MDVSKLVSFTLEKIHSNKKNADYYGIAINVQGVKQIICWLTENDFETLKSKLS